MQISKQTKNALKNILGEKSNLFTNCVFVCFMRDKKRK